MPTACLRQVDGDYGAAWARACAGRATGPEPTGSADPDTCEVLAVSVSKQHSAAADHYLDLSEGARTCPAVESPANCIA